MRRQVQVHPGIAAIMAPLTGSEKQIAWATEERNDLAMMLLEAAPQDFTQQDFITLINCRTDAAWWIENRVDIAKAMHKIHPALVERTRLNW